MKSFILILISFFLSSHFFGQDIKSDSLINEINNCSDDSSKTIAIKDAFWYCVNNNIDTINIVLDNYLNYFSQRKFDLGITYTAQAISYIYFQKGEYSNSISLLDSVYFFISSNKYKRILLMDLGEKNRMIENFNNSVSALKEAIIITKKEKNKAVLSKVYNRLAATFFEMDSLEMTLQYVDSSLSISMQKNLQWITSNNYELTGSVYHAKKDFIKSISFFLKAIKINKELNYKSSIANNYNNIGIAYFSIEKYQKALNYLKEAAELNKKHGNKYMLLTSLNFLAKAYDKTKNYKLAYFYSDSAMNLRVSIFNQEQLSKVTELNKKFELEKKEILITRQNEILKQKNILIKQQKEQKYALLLVFIILLVFVVSSIFFRKKMKTKNDKLNEQSNALDKLNQKLFANNLLLDEQYKKAKITKHYFKIQNAELKKLSNFRELNTQMIVHDLKNPLSRIINTTKSRNEELYNSALYMLNLVENILNISKIEHNIFVVDLQQISLNDVLKKAYDATSFLFKNKGINFSSSIVNKVTVLADFEILNRVFINLFSNATKYTKSGGNVLVYSKIIGNEIQITVKDDGIGIKNENIKRIFQIYNKSNSTPDGTVSSSGIGLFFVKKAIEAHKSEIVAKSDGNGAKFIFNLKLVDYSEEKENKLIPTQEIKIHLEKDESVYLRPFIDELKTNEIYEISKIKNIINKIDNKTDNIKNWRKCLLKSVNNFNTSLYEKLLKM